jgi:hypothetical protein
VPQIRHVTLRARNAAALAAIAQRVEPAGGSIVQDAHRSRAIRPAASA